MELLKRNIKASLPRVARRMRLMGLRSIIVKKFKACSSSYKNSNNNYTNIINQEFRALEPNTKWVGDITYIYTEEYGWTYLATVMDLFDLKIIGWEYSTSMTDDVAIKAIEKAYNNRKPTKGLIFHSDRGSQYTSNKYELKLNELGITHSYSKKGYPYDNACMESFNSILKKEMVNHEKYKTFNEAKISLFEFIEGWYHTRRIHSSLGYLTPNQKYESYLRTINQ
jgi:putative transposase